MPSVLSGTGGKMDDEILKRVRSTIGERLSTASAKPDNEASKRRRGRKLTLTRARQEAAKAGIPVTRYEMGPDGSVVGIVVGTPGDEIADTGTTSDLNNPWDKVKRRATR